MRLLPSWNTASLAIYAVYPSRRHLAQKVRAFVDLLAMQVTSETVEGQRQQEPKLVTT